MAFCPSCSASISFRATICEECGFDFSEPEEEPILKNSSVIHWIFESWVDSFLYSFSAIVLLASVLSFLIGFTAIFQFGMAEVLVSFAISFFLFGNSVLCYRSAVSGALQRQNIVSRFNKL